MNPRFTSWHSLLCALASLSWGASVFGQTNANIDQHDIPVQSYAMVDISGTSTNGDPVELIALDDGNKAAFSFWDGNNTHWVGLWQNGALVTGSPKVTANQLVMPSGEVRQGDTLTDDVTFDLNVNGDMATDQLGLWSYGQAKTSAASFDPDLDGFANFYVQALLDDDTIIGNGNVADSEAEYVGWSSCGKTSSSPGPLTMLTFFYLDSPGTGDDSSVTAVSSAGRLAIYRDQWPEDFVLSGAEVYIESEVAGAWNLVDSMTGAGVTPYIPSINDTKDALVTWYNGNMPSYLIEKGVVGAKEHFLHVGNDPGLIAPHPASQLRNVVPLMLSNRQTVSGSTVQPVLNMLIQADERTSAASDTWTSSVVFLLQLMSDGTTNLQKIGSIDPATNNVSIPALNVTDLQLNSINSSGVIAAIGNGGHALLLLPGQLTSVSFDGDKYWQLESDDAAAQYSAPQWSGTNGDPTASQTGEHNYAVAYTRNTIPKIGATFKIPGAANWTNMKFKVTGPDGISIPATAGTVATGGMTVTMPVTASTTALPNTVKFYNWADSTSFTLDWSISVDGGTTWAAISSTKHSVYVTLSDPLTPSSERQLTLFDTACRQATGLSATADVVAKVYSVFTHKDSNRIPDVERINPATSQPNGVELTYWSPTNPAPQPECWSTAGLLSIGDGRCGAWANFLYDALQVNGITATVETVNPPENNVPGTSGSPPSLYAAAQTKLSADVTAYLPSGTYEVIPIFFVKSWNLSSYITAPFSPVRNTGVAGQGNANPRAEFDNHAIVEYSGNDYDPSYGSPVFSSRVKWEDASLDGYGAYVINSTGGTEYKWIWELDPKGTQETIFQP